MSKHKAKGPAETKAREEVAVPAMDPAERQRRLAALAGVSQLTDVDTVEMRGERLYGDRAEGPLSVPDVTDTNTNFTVHYSNIQSTTGASVLVGAVTQWKTPDGTVYAVVSAKIRLAYTFRDLAEPPALQVLEAFANELGTHHAWPFLRERMRTIAGDLGVAPAVLPLRMMTKP